MRSFAGRRRRVTEMKHNGWGGAMRGLVIGLAVSVAVLAGCSKPADNAANATNTAAAAAPAAPVAAPAVTAPAGPAGPITLAQLPAPTAGQWSRNSSQDGAAAS